MFRKIVTGVVIAAALAGAAVVSTGSAEAHYGQNGAFAAGAGLGLLGGIIAGSTYNRSYYASEPVYYGGCHIEHRRVEDYYGWHWARVRVCDGGY
jgi:hypothetical protein